MSSARLTPLLVAALASACGGAFAGSSRPATAARALRPDPRVAVLEDELRAREAELRELRTRLSLAQAEARELRRAAETRPEPEETAFIDLSGSCAELGSVEPTEAGERIVLSGYGPVREAPRSGSPLAPVPAVSERLPVAALPPLPHDLGGAAGSGPPAPGPSVAAAPVALPTTSTAPPPPTTPTLPTAESSPEALYRRALEAFRARRFAEAATTLTDVLGQEPGASLRGRAHFWRGEARYALENYADAVTDFEGSLREDPGGGRAPDALLKAGLCHRRLGQLEAARARFERLRAEYPESPAARAIPQEGTT